ncbi:MAG: DUF2726 domain-containing protein [Pseudomonadota bacterium]|nr:DUF2726 domain-containing protein [Pseudomonadota bacterium]
MQVDYSFIVDAVREPIVTAIPFVVFGVVFLLAMKRLGHLIAGSGKGGRGRDRWHKRGRDNVRHFQPRHHAAPTQQPDAADQLRTVMTADFTAQPLLNQSEARLFKAIDRQVLEARPDWQVMAQVSLGEILRCKDADAYRCINSKRVDLLIVDEACRPLHAIEYQGGGHYKGAHATAARDAVKKEALRRAGIGYVEVVAGDTPAELRRVVERLVRGV